MAAVRASDQGGITMTQEQRCVYLLEKLLEEQPAYHSIRIPQEADTRKQLLRALFNVRPPQPADDEFLRVQDAYLREEIEKKGITSFSSLSPVQEGIYLWQGDITTLQVDAIVNAANSRLLGCFVPGHHCIDNAIHTYAGIQLRLACQEMMQRQQHGEPVGTAKITPAFNLPSQYVLHTVGPMVDGQPTAAQEMQLAACYRSCLELAAENHLQTVAFCCISTGEFRFPNGKAAVIAISAVKSFLASHKDMKVLFNVFKPIDNEIYQRLLAADRAAG